MFLCNCVLCVFLFLFFFSCSVLCYYGPWLPEIKSSFIHSFITERGIQTFDEIDLTIAAPDEGGVHVVRRSRKTNIYIPLRPSASFGRRPALVQTPVLTAL